MYAHNNAHKDLDVAREHRQAKQESAKILQADKAFKLLVASVKDYAIFMLDADGYILTWNEGAQRIKGYAVNEIVGQHFSIFYTPEANARKHPQKELELAKQNGRYEEEGWRVRKDGSMFWANVVITPLFDQGNLVGFAKVTRDLTERRQNEQFRDRALELATKANDELQKLAYVISHELQEPITSINSYCRLLLSRYRDRLGTDADRFLDEIQRGAKLTSRFVDDLWTYARVTKPGALKSNVHLGSMLEHVLSDLTPLIESTKSLVVYPPTEALPTVHCIKDQIEYVFKELITNSIKHHKSPGTPTVEISVSRERGGWTVGVLDNGPGIDRFFAQQVFSIYQKIDGKPDESGTGMGLAICRKIIEDQHQGKIGFESFVDRSGLRFFFWIPEDKEKRLTH